MRGDNKTVCVLNNGKPQKMKQGRADNLAQEGKVEFISRTRYKVLKSGVEVPKKVFKKGDREVKHYIKEAQIEAERKRRKRKEKERKK